MISAVPKGQHVVKRVRSPQGDAFSLLAITTLRLAGHLTLAGDTLAEPAGQTSARWQVLAGARAGAHSVAEIARILGVSRQGVQRLADLLEKEGLIAYADNPRHRRAKLVTLTADGAARLSEIEVRQAKWADALGGDFTVAEMARAQALMAKVIAALAREKTEPD
jgi:DNA-binding MarR family transcriptional regulator